MQETLKLRFARHGLLLLLAGLFTGFAIGVFHSPRLGNAAHVTGLIGGFGLIGVGLLWPGLKLGTRWSNAGGWMFIASMHLSWLGLAIKGALGSASDTPEAVAAGPSVALSNAIGGITLVVAAILSVAATLIALAGLRGRMG